MHSPAFGLILLGAATVGVVHSILPDHWVPLAVVARTQKSSMARLARTTILAASGHVLTSIALGGIVAVIGLQFQRQIETQQGHIVGGVLVLTGVGFLFWGLTGHGHAHEHGSGQEESNNEHDHDFRRESEHRDLRQPSRQESHDQAHEHRHQPGMALAESGDHLHEHHHGGVRHSHRHHHEVFIQQRAQLIAERSSRPTMLGRLSAIAVPFGVAASPDLSFLPFGLSCRRLWRRRARVSARDIRCGHLDRLRQPNLGRDSGGLPDAWRMAGEERKYDHIARPSRDWGHCLHRTLTSRSPA